MRRSSGGSLGRLQRLQPELWLVAAACFGIGDLVTTAIGLRISGVVEAGPLVGPLIDHYGVGALFGMKLLTMLGGYAAWRIVPSPHRAGIPLGLAVLGVVVTGWNTVVLSTVLLG